MTDLPDPAPAPAALSSASAFAAPRPRRWGGRLVIAWFALSVLVAVACVAFLAAGLAQMGWPSIHVSLDGNDMLDGVSISGLGETAKDLLAIGALLAGVLLLVLLPVVLLLALVAGLGLPLLAVAVALAVALSPLWLIGLLAWWLARRGRSPRRGRSARMPA